MIDHRAVIDPSADIAENVSVGPFSIIGPHVQIEEGTSIGSHTVIGSNTQLGKNNQVYHFASIGEDPQDKTFKGEDTYLVIGNNNIIREFTSIHRGTPGGNGVTRVGNDNMIMAYAHIAHDCEIRDHTLFVNNANLAGHVQVDDHAVIGGFVGVHQFNTVGAYSFLSRGAIVNKDVLPYIIVTGNPAGVHGLNSVGLKRAGFKRETITKLWDAYRVIYRQGLTVEQAIEQLNGMLDGCPQVQLFIDSLVSSKRGIVR